MAMARAVAATASEEEEVAEESAQVGTRHIGDAVETAAAAAASTAHTSSLPRGCARLGRRCCIPEHHIDPLIHIVTDYVALSKRTRLLIQLHHGDLSLRAERKKRIRSGQRWRRAGTTTRMVHTKQT